MDLDFDYEELSNEEIHLLLMNFLEECSTLTTKLEILHLEIRVAYDELKARAAANVYQH